MQPSVFFSVSETVQKTSPRAVVQNVSCCCLSKSGTKTREFWRLLTQLLPPLHLNKQHGIDSPRNPVCVLMVLGYWESFKYMSWFLDPETVRCTTNVLHCGNQARPLDSWLIHYSILLHTIFTAHLVMNVYSTGIFPYETCSWDWLLSMMKPFHNLYMQMGLASNPAIRIKIINAKHLA